MEYGVMMFSTDDAMHPGELARAAEERGFESLFFPEHTHIPASRLSPWPGGPALPKEYWHTNDPFVALSFAAAATTTLKVGTGICLVVEHDPITLAKQVATLDTLSGGRVIFGIGGGWNREEMANHGTDFAQRWAVLRERVVDFCDGWMPIAGRDDVAEGIVDLRRRALASGRDPASISVSIFGAPPKPERLDEYRRAAVDRAIFALPAQERDVVLPILDRLADLVRSLER